MSRPLLALLANPIEVIDIIQDNTFSEFNLIIGTESSVTVGAVLALVYLHQTEFEIPASPWLVWDQTGDPQMINKAYLAGARSVFLRETPVTVVIDTVKRTLKELLARQSAPVQKRRRTYRHGELILLEADAVLSIDEGILATTMIHSDGTIALLGLSGKGQILIAHPEDSCQVQIVAHTDTIVQIEPWASAVHTPDFALKLKDRLQQMEGWAAMQARTSLSQRVLGILGLLAGQLGCEHELGICIDARITHTQLASAVGSNRTSITRALGELRDAGKISVISVHGEDRLIICDNQLVEGHRCR